MNGNALMDVLKQPRTLIRVVLVVVVLIFIVQNTGRVTVKILFADVSMSLAIWIIVMLLIGFVVGYLSARVGERQRHKGE